MSSFKSAYPKVGFLPPVPLSPSKVLRQLGPQRGARWCPIPRSTGAARSLRPHPHPRCTWLSLQIFLTITLALPSVPLLPCPGTSCLVALQGYGQTSPPCQCSTELVHCSVWNPSLPLLFLHLNSTLSISPTVHRIPRPEIWVLFQIPPHPFPLGPTAKGH